MKLAKSWKMLMLASAAMAPSGGALAQAAPEGVRVQELVVTARKRDEPLLNVPEAVSALGGASLAARNITGALDLSRIVPSLSVVETAPGQNELTLRGMSTSFTLAPAVALYLDETPLDLRTDVRAASPDLELFDVDRVEVVRGPQGALFGADSLGGIVRIIQHGPDIERPSFHSEVSASTVQGGGAGYAFKAAGGAPLNDQLAFRAVAAVEGDPGYSKRVTTADYNNMSPSDPVATRDLGSNQRVMGRLELSWRPLEGMSVEPSAYVSFSKARGINYADSNRAHYTFTGDIDPTLSDRLAVFSLVVKQHLGFADLTSSSAYIDRRTRAVDDYSTIAAFFYGQLTGLPEGPPFRMPSQEPVDFQEWNEELRLTSSGTGPLRWVVGGLFERVHDQSDQYADSATFGPIASALLGVPTDTRLNGFFEPITDLQIAGFADADYDLGRFVTLSGGLRAYELRQSAAITQDGLFGGPSLPQTKTSQSGIDPRGSVMFKLGGGASIYATVAKGFRPGLANAPVVQPPGGCPGMEAFKPFYNPDRVWNHELGMKLQAADGRASLSAAVYRTEWNDMQAPVNGLCGTYFANIGDARIDGVELEAEATPAPGLSLNGAFSYNDARIRSIHPDASAVGAVSGDRVVALPRLQYSVGGEYRRSLTRGVAAYLRLDLQYTGGTPAVYGSSDPRTYQPAYANVGAGVGIERGPFEIEMRARNLLNNYQVSAVYESLAVFVPPNTVRSYVNAPRTLQLVVRYRP